MIFILVSVRDNAIEAFQPVNSVRATGEALRGFIDAVNDPQNRQLHAHPEDFDLYSIGTFNDQTGELTHHKPERLMRGIDAKKGSQA